MALRWPARAFPVRGFETSSRKPLVPNGVVGQVPVQDRTDRLGEAVPTKTKSGE